MYTADDGTNYTLNRVMHSKTSLSASLTDQLYVGSKVFGKIR